MILCSFALAGGLRDGMSRSSLIHHQTSNAMRAAFFGGNSPSLAPSSPKPNSMWLVPSMGCLKWNVHASFNRHLSRSAVGGVLRNHQGHFMCLFSNPIPLMEINSAEVSGIHRTISISWVDESLRGASITLESDSANAVSWCNSPDMVVLGI